MRQSQRSESTSDKALTEADLARLDAVRREAREAAAQARLESKRLTEDLRAQIQGLAEHQRALGEQMRAAAQPMERHGAEMRALGRELEAALDAADAKATALLGAAIANGKATPAK
jgi:hypothetical protein